ncbi:MAG: DUF4340 domain-containing protein [Desulfovibrionaceae bacterium]|jgi:hypothetical protein|nr:DUF4340 domain-containing protein [Desulfovibrionaceae bacterium]
MKRLLILLILATGVWSAAAYWTAAPKDAGSDRGQDPSWPEVTAERVGRVECNATGGASFVLALRNGQWYAGGTGANATFTARADADKVRGLMEFVSHNKPERRLEGIGRDKAAEFGLDAPRLSVTFEAAQPWTLCLGDANPSGDGVYATSSLEDRILLLGAKYRQHLERPETYYHDLRLTDSVADDVERVRVTGPGAVGDGEWEAQRTEKGFVFTWPDRLKERTVNQGELDLYLHTLVTMKGARYLAGSPKGMPGPYLRVQIWRKKAAVPTTIELYDLAAGSAEAPMETRFLTVSDWQGAPVELDRDRAVKLSRTAFSLMERKVASVDLGRITRQRVVQKGHDGKPAQEVVAVKKDKGWVTSPDGREMVGMDMLTWRLTDLKYEAEPLSQLPDSARYALTWELFGADDKPVTELVFYLDPDLPEHLCWVKVLGEDRFYPVPDKLLEDLQGQLPLGKTGAAQ